MRKRLILATTSARRIELLKRLGIEFDVVEPIVNERMYNDPVKIVIENARRKAEYALSIVPRDSVVVGIDTIIYSPDIGVVGKPYSVLQAREILVLLRGKWHSVYSGVFIIDKESLRYHSFVEETRVKMRNYSDDELDYYIMSLEPLGKAGAYAIQGLGALLIETIVGDYYNIVGLPLTKLYLVLKKYFGIDLLEEGARRYALGKNRLIRGLPAKT